MKQKKSILFVIVLGCVALLIIGIGSTIANVTAQEQYTVSRPVSSQPMSPTGGGGPGPVDNWFTYQGYLEDNGAPVNEPCDFEFSLWDSSGAGVPPTGGIQIGTTEPISSLPVTDGLFSYPLNAWNAFGSDAFNGQRRYLQIAVRCPINSGDFTTLAPRQLLTAAPYALSLRPGAIISATQNNALLTVVNTYTADTHGSAISARGSSPTAPVIAAYHEGTGHALYGSSDSGYPTIGGVNAGNGVGVDGRSTGGNGVYGYTGSSTNGIGVVGLQTGYSTSDLGNWWKPGGFFGGRNGVAGVTKVDSGIAVFGSDISANGGWAGYFRSDNGVGVYASVPAGHAGFNTNGTKPAVVRTDEGARLMYSEESTQIWFSDYGFAQLQDGTAVISIDPLYAQTVNLDEPYHVFLQAYGDVDLYVNGRTAGQFTVHMRDGDANAEFSYRIVALRLGHEGLRMDPAPWADNDPNLYPEKANDPLALQQGGQ